MPTQATSPPCPQRPHDQRLAEFVGQVLCVFTPVFLAIDLAFRNPLGVATDLTMLTSGVLALGLLRSGRERLGAWILTVAVWAPPTIAVQAIGGPESPFFGLHFVTLSFAAVLVGPAGTALLATLTLVAVWLPAGDVLPHTATQQRATWSGMLVLVAAMLLYTVPYVRNAFARLERTVTSLEATTVSRDHLAGVLDALGEWILVTDDHGCVVEVSGGRGLFPDAHDVVGLGVDAVLLNLGVGPAPVRRAQVRSAGGHLLDVLVSVGSLPTGQVWAVTDVSDLMHAHKALHAAYQQAEAASAAKSSFLAQMSHELRTPLNAIIGYSELLADESDDPSTRADLDRIDRSAHRLLGLIDSVLDLSKIEAGVLEVEVTDFDLRALLDDVLEVVRPVFLHRGLTLDVEGHLDGPLVSTDAQRLQQVLLNLLSNSAKFTDEGGVVVQVERWQRHRMPWIRIRVEDTGIGLSGEELAHVFRPFQRGRTEGREGTGLGLAICHAYIEQMGGQLYARSKVGVGSTFIVELPARQAVDYDPTADTDHDLPRLLPASEPQASPV